MDPSLVPAGSPRLLDIEGSRFDADWLDRHLGSVAGDDFEMARQAGLALEAEEALREAAG